MHRLEVVAVDPAHVSAFIIEAHKPLEALIHGFCDEAYTSIMESCQDYLRDNVLHNLQARLDTAERQAKDDRQRAELYRSERNKAIAILDALRRFDGWDGTFHARKAFEAKEKARALLDDMEPL